MTDTTELRQLLGLVNSHLDRHDVSLLALDYDVDGHAESTGPTYNDIEITGNTVRFEVEYTFKYE